MKVIYKFIILFVICFLLFFTDLFLGSVYISFNEFLDIFFNSSETSEHLKTIFYNFRLPKAITASIVGMALAVSGLQMQVIFRNPLAGPYVLGISSGAGLGVALVILGLSSFVSIEIFSALSNWSIIIAAWIGAGIVLLLILVISIRIKDIMTLLILGIMFGAVSSAIVSILQYFSEQSLLKSYVVWTMGSLGNITSSELTIMAASVFVGLLIVVFLLKNLNVLLIGETYAKSLGVNIKTTRILIFISTSILAGSVTAFCGPIAFVGIVIPHIARMFFKTADHKILFLAVILFGIILMLISDIIAHLPGSDKILPINSVTALLGIPIVIWIVVKNHKFKLSV